MTIQDITFPEKLSGQGEPETKEEYFAALIMSINCIMDFALNTKDKVGDPCSEEYRSDLDELLHAMIHSIHAMTQELYKVGKELGIDVEKEVFV